MEHGKIADSERINRMIYHCFEYICEEDKQRFQKQFQEQPDDSDQIMHTFRELVLGAYLSSKGFRVRHEYVIDGQAPDWSILDAKGEWITGIVELASFHIDRATEDGIEKQMRARGIAGYWRDQNKDNVERLYHCIWNKAAKYKSLVDELGIPYIVAVFPDFKALVDLEEVQLCLSGSQTGL